MLARSFPALAVVLALLPVPLRAQIAIEHKAAQCIVAGRYFKLDGCFSPMNDLARARLDFKPDGSAHWFFVDMKSGPPPLVAEPCATGIGPPPKKSLVGKSISIYLEATSRSFVESRTPEYAARVVEKESDCRREEVAAWLTKAEVKVGSLTGGSPSPFFEVGGGAKYAIGAAAVGVVGAGVAVASGGQGGTASPGPSPTPAATPSATPSPTPSPTPGPPTTTLQACRPVFRVSPNPPEGRSPLTVLFDMCESTGPDPRYIYDFDGDGVEDRRGVCSASFTYTAPTPSGTTPVSKPYRAVIGFGCTPGPLFEQAYTIVVTSFPSLGSTAAQAAERRLSWTSQLDVPGATSQIVINGSAAVFSGRGRSMAAAVGRRGENRIEAQIVEATGQGGTWRFELGSTPSFEPGSLKAIAGEVVLITADTIVFRLQGKPGERVMFTFRAER